MSAGDDASTLHPDHDPANYAGFTRFQLRILDRFRRVAVDDHLQEGNLDGTGDSPEVTAHETGIVSSEQLFRQYDLPIAITIPTGTTTESRTMGADTARLTFSTSAWVSDYDQPYGMTEAQVIVGNIVNNVEENRTLFDGQGQDPLAEDTTLVSTDYDFVLNAGVQSSRHLKFGTAEFEVRTKRRLPR